MTAPKLTDAQQAELHDFARYLRLERGRSAHTITGYLRDVTSLLTFANALGEEVELATMRDWLAQRSE
ncbi:site-specific integrase, partial [Prevotella bivia]|nr:site-specific integrase [Prevotella bivia]